MTFMQKWKNTDYQGHLVKPVRSRKNEYNLELINNYYTEGVNATVVTEVKKMCKLIIK